MSRRPHPRRRPRSRRLRPPAPSRRRSPPRAARRSGSTRSPSTARGLARHSGRNAADAARLGIGFCRSMPRSRAPNCPCSRDPLRSGARPSGPRSRSRSPARAGPCRGPTGAEPGGDEGRAFDSGNGAGRQHGGRDPGIKIRDAHPIARRASCRSTSGRRRSSGRPAARRPARSTRPCSPGRSGLASPALTECPVEVARHRHMSARQRRVREVHAALDDPPDRPGRRDRHGGQLGVNDRVMDCVKRQMNGWSFTPPEGGSVRLERPFRFGAR